MTVTWSRRASKSFASIKSIHFSPEETTQYKLQLLQRIHEKIVQTGRLFPSKLHENTYFIRIDRYVVSYEVSEDQSLYTITAFKHMKQN